MQSVSTGGPPSGGPPRVKTYSLSSKCFCCGLAGGEDVNHMMFSCPAWDDEREVLEPLLSEVRAYAVGYNTTLSRGEIVTLLLGGCVAVDVDDTGETEAVFTLGEMWSLGPDLGNGERGMPLSAQVAAYLSAIDTRRKDLLYRVLLQDDDEEDRVSV